MRSKGLERAGIVAVTVLAVLVGAHGASADEIRPGALYGDFLWTGFIDELEELYRPGVGWALGYLHPVAGDWSVALEIGARYHDNRARHGEDSFEDPGIKDAEIRGLGPADDFRMIPWTAQVRWNIPWSPWPEDADLAVGAGVGGYSIRWAWNDPDELVNKTFFGANGGVHLSWHRSEALDFIVGGTYHIVSIDDLYDEDDLYHILELRIGVALHLSELRTRH
jgi:hypothetical protein